MIGTGEIRDLDDEAYSGLAQRATKAGISVSEVLRWRAHLLAARTALDELRGPWPDADRA